jgi:hypothetical protein
MRASSRVTQSSTPQRRFATSSTASRARVSNSVSFYNYGMLPERNLDWIGAATEPHC